MPLLLLLFLLTTSCSWNAAGMTGCQRQGPTSGLPGVLRESSGVAWSRARPDVLFSHNDGGHEANIFALNLQGELLGVIPVKGARNRDWEDMATGDCGGRACIYLADIGDNQEVRRRITLYRLADTGIYDGTPQEAEAFSMVLPDGPRDMESVFVLPGEEVFFVSKGRNHAVTVYRYPPPLRPDETVTLEAVQILTQGREPIPSQVTGADASLDGRTVAVRSYQALQFFHVEDGHLEEMEDGRVFLRTLNEAQGEAVGLGPRGEVVLTSEGAFGRGPTMTTLQCTILTRPEGGPSLRGTWRLLPSVATFSLRFTPPLAWKAPCREEPDVPADA